ncbi:neuroligin 4-like [Stomoxys calcitrans]|uniref:neuroligin 4-like n=1 Tax=Stomoxys calcitrans TaxID=35570 RepID=UPI0027E382D0|nr:neuroligin 4-like [Stomoxys calcitrans]
MRLNKCSCLATGTAAAPGTTPATSLSSPSILISKGTEPLAALQPSIIQKATATTTTIKDHKKYAQPTNVTKRKTLSICRKSASMASPKPPTTSDESLTAPNLTSSGILTPTSICTYTTSATTIAPASLCCSTRMPSMTATSAASTTTTTTTTTATTNRTLATSCPSSDCREADAATCQSTSIVNCPSSSWWRPTCLWHWWQHRRLLQHRLHPSKYPHHWRWHSLTTVLLVLVCALVSPPPATFVAASTLDIYKNARLGHRIVQTRYGRLHGLILPLDSYRYLRSVEVFLGVPYATPPTKQNRFSPTRAPAPWDGIRISDKYSPVCPQRLPNIQNETAALEKMPKGRLEYLKRLLPFLENQSEDCLYLNIFSPINAGASEKKLPVIVFIHGESFEWSSGNPYDGSVLASYGEVVVVTLNYRLGILGFLNANPNPQQHARVANYGLMDQIAALHWIQQNIQKFGGDPNAVTLAGHGTGAACINYLMSTPTMVRGLFHRAILMSGSAYSSWALVEDPVMFAVKLAKEVNCSIPEDLDKHHEQIVDCLREVPLEDLYAADIQTPTFLTSFGPSVDGVVIRPGHSNLDIDDLMTRSTKRSSSDGGGGSSGGGGGNYGNGGGGGYFNGGGPGGGNGFGGMVAGHYDVLFGVVTGESIWRFSAHDIQNGFEGERRDKIIRTYVRNAYNYHLNEIFFTKKKVEMDKQSQGQDVDALSKRLCNSDCFFGSLVRP